MSADPGPPPSPAPPSPGAGPAEVRHPPGTAGSPGSIRWRSLCSLHDAGTCPSCPHQDTAPETQLEHKQARVADLLARGANPVPLEAWLAPVGSAPSRFRNKAKMVVSGTADAPVLGILDRQFRGVDLRRCPLHVPLIEQSLPVIADLITELNVTPYDVRTRRGELKHVLLTASPDGDLMVRLVLRSRARLGAIRRALPRFRILLPTLAVLSVNIQPIHQAVIEGPEEIIVTDGLGGDHLLMRLQLSDEGPDGAPAGPCLELPLVLPTRSFFQTNTAVAERLYSTARSWANDPPHPTRPAPALSHARPERPQSGHARTEHSGSDHARPEHAGSEHPQPEHAGSDHARPEHSGSEHPQPEHSRSEHAGSDHAQPEHPQPQHSRSDHARPEHSGSEHVRPEPLAPHGGRPREIWDLFCGVGGFALALAGPGRRVLGVEVSDSAIDGARAAAAMMRLGPSEVRFEPGDAHLLDPGGGPVPDLLVVNPPRRGIGPQLAARIETCGVERVLYSSCNPETLKSDLEAMASLRVRRARLFDMFPHTDHAEVLVELVRATDAVSLPAPPA